MPDSALDILEQAINAGDFRRLILSQPRNGSELVKATVTPVTVRNEPHLQFALFTESQVSHENLVASAALSKARDLFDNTFGQGLLSTSRYEFTFHRKPDGTWKIKRRALAAAADQTANKVPHNRSKSYLIPENTPCPFLYEAGVMTATGQVRSAMYHKFRQINRYLELIEDIIPALPTDRSIEVVDFGCGKSYLTFALHHLLTVVHKRCVHVVGLDRKSEVVENCSQLAKRLDCRGLEFREGDLTTYAPPGPVDLALSLHACDTATDAALARAIAWSSPVILAVPCCQHELAPKIESANLQPLLRHGLSRDRFAALATDSLRAQLLEICGYTTQVVEFIDLEHTQKNVLLRSVRRQQPDPHRQRRITEYLAFRNSLNITDWSLQRSLQSHLPAEVAIA